MSRGKGPAEAILAGSPALRAGVVDHGACWILQTSGVLNIYGELDRDDVQRIAAHAKVGLIQFARKFAVPAAMLQLLDQHVVAAHPRVRVRETLNGFGAFDDLAFLEHLPGLRALGVAGYHAIDLAPIARYVSIEELGIGGLGTSLSPLAGYPSPVSCYLHERVEDVETVATWPRLERLMIRELRIASFEWLVNPTLRELELEDVNGVRSYASLAGLRQLRTLIVRGKLTPAQRAELTPSRFPFEVQVI